MIKVSVIVPVYKVPEQYLRECLDSLIKQTLQESEFIIVSDGAPKFECSICEEYTKKDSRIKFFRREHAGVSAARNFGMEQVQGEYIGFVDSDDWCDTSMFSNLYTFAKQNDADVITTDFFISQNGKDIYNRQQLFHFNGNYLIQQILLGNIFGGMPLRLIKRNFYKLHPATWPENLNYCEDVVFWAKFLKSNPSIGYLNQAFYHYNQDNSLSITHNYTLDTFNERKKFIKILKGTLPSYYKRELNMAAFNVKMEAMSHKLLKATDFISFEKTSFFTIFLSSLPKVTKIYLCFQTVVLLIFKRTYKEYI